MDATAPEPAVATTAPGPGPDRAAAFEAFFRATEPRLRRALVAAYGPDLGRDAASEALTYAWGHLGTALSNGPPAGLLVSGRPDTRD